MNNIILQPTGNKDAREHYQNTIKSPVRLDSIKHLISDYQYNKLNSIYSSGEVCVWGVTAGKNNVNKKKWDKVKVGDITLFSANKKIFASAVTTYKMHHKKLAEHLWQYNVEGETWEYIYFVGELQNQDISYSLFNNIVGYKSNFIIQGFSVLDNDKSNALINYFEFDSKVYYEEVDDTEYQETILKILENKELDTKTNSTARTEQSFLRKYLFEGKKKAKCGVCGKEFPVEFLVTAHIKKRALCTKEERLDYKNIVMPMCKFGCDDLYERGFIFVADGKIKINESKKLDCTSINEYLKKINGNEVTYWNNGTEHYFEAHRKLAEK